MRCLRKQRLQASSLLCSLLHVFQVVFREKDRGTRRPQSGFSVLFLALKVGDCLTQLIPPFVEFSDLGDYGLTVIGDSQNMLEGIQNDPALGAAKYALGLFDDYGPMFAAPLAAFLAVSNNDIQQLLFITLALDQRHNVIYWFIYSKIPH